MPPTHAIEATGLVKRYGEKTALGGVDIVVPTGTVTAVLGPNGAGKTTAVRILTTLTDADRGRRPPSPGSTCRTQPTEVRRRIGLAAQDATVDPLLTGHENLVMIGELHQLPRKEAKARADRPARPVLPGRRRRPGRLAATRAACAAGSTWPPPSWPTPRSCSSTSPPPASTPGPATSCGTCSTRWSARGTTILLTTQYLEEADRLADDILVVDHGRIIAQGDARSLKRQVGGDNIGVTVSDPARLDEAAAILGAGHRLRARRRPPRSAPPSPPPTTGVAGLADGGRRPGRRRHRGRGPQPPPAHPRRGVPHPHRGAHRSRRRRSTELRRRPHR